MKKSSLISLILLIGIFSSLCLSPVVALNPEGYWGMSAGDELYYKVTSNNTGSQVVTYAKVNVTSIYNGSIVVGIPFYYNFINATTYVYSGTAWVESYPDTQWAGWNSTTFQWYGAYQASLGFPNPAPLTFSWSIVNISIYYWLNIAWAGSIQSGLEGNTVYYTNSSEEFYITYDPVTGVCANNTHLIEGNLWTKQEYLGEIDPFAEEPTPRIPGFNPILIVSILGIAALLIGLKIKKK
ncbi:MAG: hypothetical protein JW776_14410 [Candidatus Lokiarchaeota archaeon]|nr:hypothetical protein [Candidatus Lokiarchaeota archaeon]